MTTIFAIRCKDGIVMVADTQATGEAKETATKITPIGENAILGCSGNEIYIPKLEDAFQGFSPDGNFKESVNLCVRRYSSEVARDMAAAGVSRTSEGYVPNLYETDAILAFSDDRFELHLFHVAAPYGAREEKKAPYRLSVGSGGLLSNFVLKTLEDQPFKVAQLTWAEMTVQEVKQFSELLLIVIGLYEKYTSPIGEVWCLSTVERHPRKSDTLETWGTEHPTWPLTILLKTVLGHHPEQFKRWVKNYLDADPDLKDRLFALLTS